MKLILLLFALFISVKSLAYSDSAFEEKLEKITSRNEELMIKEYHFDRAHNSNELTDLEILELQNIRCASFQSEFEFYKFTIKNFEDYKIYLKKFGLTRLKKEKLEDDYAQSKERMEGLNLKCK